MKPRISMLAILLGVAVGLWLNFRPTPELSEPARPPGPPAASAAATVPPARTEPTPPLATVARALAATPAPAVRPPPPAGATAPVSAPPAASRQEAAPISDELAAAVRGEIEQAKVMLRDYRSLYGENPVGTNAEIMRALMGGNPRGATLGPFEGATLNGAGELLDRWGTPYFFHQLAKDRMEIISAGPDRKLFTADDLQ